MTRPKYINKPFQNLPLKQRAVFILHLSGLSTREIAKLFVTSHMSISRYIIDSYDLLGSDFVTKRRISMRGESA